MRRDDENREIRALLTGAGEAPDDSPAARRGRELELPPPAPAPPGFAARVAARAAADARRSFELPLAPGWARAAAALALVAGIAGGAGLGLLGGATSAAADDESDLLAWSEEGFAEELVDGFDAALTSAPAATPEATP